MMLEHAVTGIYPIAVTALFLIALFVALLKYFLRAFGIIPRTRCLHSLCAGSLRIRKNHRASISRVILHVLLAFFLSRIIMWLIGYFGCLIDGIEDYFLRDQKAVFTQWDASHYLGIAEHGYRTTGDARLHIVFYPLYPYLVRLFTFGFLPYHVSAMLISNLCLIGSGFLLYAVTDRTYGKKCAVLSVWLMMFSPAAAFYSMPYTESLFLFLTLSSLYFAREKRFLPALLFAALSAFTRLPGAASAVFVFFEMLRTNVSALKRSKSRVECLRRASFHAAKSFALCLLILTGFAAYLLINKLVTGNAFTFLKYQSEHWGQQTGSLFETASYSIKYAFHPFEEWYRLGVYLPQCFIILVVMLFMVFSAKKMHPGDLAYSVVYTYITLIPTMLISGPRYQSALYAFYPMAALLASRNRLLKALILLMFAAMYGYGAYMYFVKRIYL